MKKNTAEDFWRQVDKAGAEVRPGLGSCWVWTGRRHQSGYGMFEMLGVAYAHRCSWALHNGRSPGDLCVLHVCDNPVCVRPEHLFLGTHTENVADRDRKDRTQRPKGLRKPDGDRMRKLASSGMTRREIGAIFGVSHTYVNQVVWGWWLK